MKAEMRDAERICTQRSGNLKLAVYAEHAKTSGLFFAYTELGEQEPRPVFVPSSPSTSYHLLLPSKAFNRLEREGIIYAKRLLQRARD